MKTLGELLAADGGHQNWVPLLDTAAKEVFELMLSSQLTTADAAAGTTMDVTAMVGLAGQLCGVLSVRCTQKSAALMTSKMLGVAFDKAGPEIADALGEVCNMVAGNFKNKIVGLAEGCMLSPPTVITGSDYKLYSVADTPAVELTMMFESMPIGISLQIHS
jgi:chemotaxis protein CheX